MNKTLEEIHKIIAEREHGEKKKSPKKRRKKEIFLTSLMSLSEEVATN